MTGTKATGTLVLLIFWLSIAGSVSADLVQYWALEDGAANAADLTADNSATGGNPGTLVGFSLDGTPGDIPGDWITSGLAPTLTHSTGALDFNGPAAAYVAGGNIGLTAGTVSMWINQRSATGDDRLFSPASGPVAQGGGVRIGAGGSIGVWPGHTDWFSLAPAGTIGLGTWQHVAIAYTGSHATAYVDGTQYGTVATPFDFNLYSFGIAQRFLNQHGSAFDGAIDDVAIWDSALPSSKIAALAGGTSPENVIETPQLVQYWPLDDGSTNAADLTADNSVAGGNPGALANFSLNGTPNDVPGDWITTGLQPALTHSTGALDFDTAANNYINAGDIGLTGGTVSMWINQGTAIGDIRLFMPLNGTGAMGGGVRIGNDTTADGRLQAWTGATYVDLAPAGTINPGTWQHVAITYSSGMATAYVDGTQFGTVATPFDFAGRNLGIGAKYIGQYGNAFDGAIDDVAIWDMPLPADKIAELAGGASPVTITAVIPPADAVTLPFSEDFDSGSAPDFTLSTGDWAFTGGELNNNAAGNGALSAAAVQVTGDLATTGIRMSSTFQADTFDGNNDVGFAAFGTTGAFELFAGGNDNHYLADVKPDGSMRILQINTPCCGSIETIATGDVGSFSFSTGETYDLIFEATPDGGGGLDLSLTIDDPSQGPITIAGTDTTPLTGDFFGYRTRVDAGLTGSGVLAATFDDFALAVPEPSAAVLLLLGGIGLLLGSRRRRRR